MKYTKKRKELIKSTPGGPNSNLLKLQANGETFTKIVTHSYREGILSGRDASSLLDVKLNRIDKIYKMIIVYPKISYCLTLKTL